MTPSGRRAARSAPSTVKRRNSTSTGSPASTPCTSVTRPWPRWHNPSGSHSYLQDSHSGFFQDSPGFSFRILSGFSWILIQDSFRTLLDSHSGFFQDSPGFSFRIVSGFSWIVSGLSRILIQDSFRIPKLRKWNRSWWISAREPSGFLGIGLKHLLIESH